MLNSNSLLYITICVYCIFYLEINLQLSFPAPENENCCIFMIVKNKIKSGQYLAGTGFEKVAGSAGAVTGTGFPVVHWLGRMMMTVLNFPMAHGDISHKSDYYYE